MTKKALPETDATPAEKIESIKGFDANLKCRDYQFEIGKTYSVGGQIEACKNGFHACPIDQHPLSVFEFYPPAASRYAIVEQFGSIDQQGTKLASASLTVKIEIPLSDLIHRAVKWVFDRATPENSNHATGDCGLGAASATGYRGAASATGYRGAASATGDCGAASATGKLGAASATGDCGAASATGNLGAASATGYLGAASATGELGAASATGKLGAASATGDCGAASATGNLGAASATGYLGAASATGYLGAASAAGDCGAASATGDRGAASATGYRGAASATGELGAASATGNLGAASATGDCGAASATGYRGAASATGELGAASATGKHSIAIAAGLNCRAMAGKTNAIVIVHRDQWSGEIIHIFASKAGENGIEPGKWYQLGEDGKPFEVDANGERV